MCCHPCPGRKLCTPFHPPLQDYHPFSQLIQLLSTRCLQLPQNRVRRLSLFSMGGTDKSAQQCLQAPVILDAHMRSDSTTGDESLVTTRLDT